MQTGATLLVVSVLTVVRDSLALLALAELAVLALPLLILAGSELVGANVFIAAFVGGLTFGAVSRSDSLEPEVAGLLETGSKQLLSVTLPSLA